jgi:hypothetical protein
MQAAPKVGDLAADNAFVNGGSIRWLLQYVALDEK